MGRIFGKTDSIIDEIGSTIDGSKTVIKEMGSIIDEEGSISYKGGGGVSCVIMS